jgi:HemK-like putative methylase
MFLARVLAGLPASKGIGFGRAGGGADAPQPPAAQPASTPFCVPGPEPQPTLCMQERVPFQYLIHSAHWREHVLSVGPGVLVPRPETEQMVDMAAAALAARPALARSPWADLGTGSGALAVGLAHLLAAERGAGARAEARQPQRQQAWEEGTPAGGGDAPEPAVWAVDVSPAARAYAAANAAACAPPGAVAVVAGSWWEPLVHLRGRLGGVLTNPPYIPRREMAGLQREVGGHEPAGALDGGPGPGLDSLEARGRRRAARGRGRAARRRGALGALGAGRRARATRSSSPTVPSAPPAGHLRRRRGHARARWVHRH